MRKRSLGDEQCFIIPMAANRGGKSGWTVKIQSQSTVTWTVDRLGTISGNWHTARRTIAIMKRASTVEALCWIPPSLSRTITKSRKSTRR